MVRNFFSVAALLAIAIASTLTADVDRHAPPLTSVARAELRTISTRLEGALSQVLIESSEPVAYVTSQPDPLTVLVDLRNVKPGMLPPGILGPLPPVADVRVEEAGGRRSRSGARARQARVSRDAPRAQLAQHDLRRGRSRRQAAGGAGGRRCAASPEAPAPGKSNVSVAPVSAIASGAPGQPAPRRRRRFHRGFRATPSRSTFKAPICAPCCAPSPRSAG